METEYLDFMVAFTLFTQVGNEISSTALHGVKEAQLYGHYEV